MTAPTYSAQGPRTVTPPAAPARHTPSQPRTPGAVRPVPAAPDRPSRWHLLVPRRVRNLAEGLGLWQNPTPLIPSDHLAQTLAVLERHGWGQSLDFSPTGRMCIRGGQTLLEHLGYVTPTHRARAVDYMQQTLREHGVHEAFHAWNDHTGRTFTQVSYLINRSANAARKNGE
ncbi:hypothetical protein AB0454_23040 [Streptomyces sp. NPDC093509]|uniref:DUF6197 family protein n=1 Tax=Streptomyces sp. NPDC093509 TaxID=3154982 RepID=UPI00344B13FE